MEKLLLPKFGQTMEEGIIVDWFISEGSSFSIGDDLYEVETEKSNVTVEATISGTLYKILVSAGSSVEIGTTVGVVVADGEQPNPDDLAAFLGLPAPARVDDRPDVGTLTSASGSDSSPAVSNGQPALELAGDGSRIASRTRLEGQRKATARIVAESWRDIPHFQQVVLADATSVVQERAQLLAQVTDESLRVSLNDVLIDRIITAIEEVPAINSTYRDDVITEYADIDIAVAVATEDGLLAPVLRRSNKLSLTERAQALRDLARRSAAGELLAEDLERPTITVSNLGMYGVDTGFALVTRPQAAIVFLGRITERPMVVKGSVVPRQSVYLSVSYDHRVVDGAIAARFLSALRRSVETERTSA